MIIKRSNRSESPESSLAQMGKTALAKITAINSKHQAAIGLKNLKVAAVELQERGASLQNTYDQAYQKDAVRTSSYLETFLFTSITTRILVRSELGKNISEVAKNTSEVSKNLVIEKMSVSQQYLAELQANQIIADKLAAAVGLASNSA